MARTGAPEKYSPEQMVAAIRATKGLVTQAARRLGCSPTTVDAYARRYAVVREALEDARRELVDAAELALMKAISNGEPWAVGLVLKTLGKSRGYVERVEQTGADGGPIQHDLGPLPLREIVLEVPALPAGSDTVTDTAQSSPNSAETPAGWEHDGSGSVDNQEHGSDGSHDDDQAPTPAYPLPAGCAALHGTPSLRDFSPDQIERRFRQDEADDAPFIIDADVTVVDSDT